MAGSAETEITDERIVADLEAARTIPLAEAKRQLEAKYGVSS